ncbi:hypothetical protein Tco_0966563 [Tanacetum coccineum]
MTITFDDILDQFISLVHDFFLYLSDSFNKEYSSDTPWCISSLFFSLFRCFCCCGETSDEDEERYMIAPGRSPMMIPRVAFEANPRGQPKKKKAKKDVFTVYFNYDEIALRLIPHACFEKIYYCQTGAKLSLGVRELKSTQYIADMLKVGYDNRNEIDMLNTLGMISWNWLNGIRIYHKNRGISERIANMKEKKSFQFDKHGTGSTPDKAFDVDD